MYNLETQLNNPQDSICVDNEYVPNDAPVRDVLLKRFINHSFAKCTNIDDLCHTYMDLRHHLDDMYRHYVYLYVNEPKEVETTEKE